MTSDGALTNAEATERSRRQPATQFGGNHGTLADASRVLANYGFFPPAGQLAGGATLEGERTAAIALAGAQAICNDLELRDAHGRLVPTDWINVFGGRTAEEAVSVMFTVEHDAAGALAQSPHRSRNNSGHVPPAR